MDFIAWLKTSKEYESSDVIVAFHMVFERGLLAMEDKGEQFHADIIKDIISNSPLIGRE